MDFIMKRLLTTLTTCLLLCAQAFAAATEKPNIIFVLFDDMGYGQPEEGPGPIAKQTEA